MPKYDLISEEIKWCEEHRNPAEEVYQDGFIAGLRHALFLMKSRPTQDAADRLPRCRNMILVILIQCSSIMSPAQTAAGKACRWAEA